MCLVLHYFVQRVLLKVIIIIHVLPVLDSFSKFHFQKLPYSIAMEVWIKLSFSYSNHLSNRPK
jgi:hypothetical protein